MSVVSAPWLLALDLTSVFPYLTMEDLYHYACCSKKTQIQARMYDAVFYAKLEARPHLQTWRSIGIACRGDGYKWQVFRQKLSQDSPFAKTVERASSEELSVADFQERFQSKSIPVCICGLTGGWVASDSWSFASLVERFGQEEFRFDDNFGEKIELRAYAEYIQSTVDDCPLGLYDSQFAENPNSPLSALVEEYAVPPYFAGNDLFAGLPQDIRPPWRWLLVGTGRSGTELHIDPLYTSAWVTLLEGRKRWCFFPPGTDTDLLGGLSGGDSPALPALDWYLRFYGDEGMQGLGCITVLQHAGETVFVPAGWAHVVINLEITVAITHNYADRGHLRAIWEKCSEDEPHMLQALAAQLLIEERAIVGEDRLDAGMSRCREGGLVSSLAQLAVDEAD